jgi:hypothetical protein
MKFKSRGQHEKHAVEPGTWEPSQNLFEIRGKTKKTSVEMAGCTLTSSEQSGKQNNTGDSLTFP